MWEQTGLKSRRSIMLHIRSIVRISEINYIDKILPGHNEIGFENRFSKVLRQAFEELKDNNLLHHGSGLHEYDSFKIKL